MSLLLRIFGLPVLWLHFYATPFPVIDQAGLAEKAKADAERADRIQAQYQAAMDAKAARDKEKREDETRQRIDALNQQVNAPSCKV